MSAASEIVLICAIVSEMFLMCWNNTVVTIAGCGYKLSFHVIQAAKVFNPNDVRAARCAGHVVKFALIDFISNAKYNHLRRSTTRCNLFKFVSLRL